MCYIIYLTYFRVKFTGQAVSVKHHLIPYLCQHSAVHKRCSTSGCLTTYLTPWHTRHRNMAC